MLISFVISTFAHCVCQMADRQISKPNCGKLGLIVGGGDLPLHVAQIAAAGDIPIHAVNLLGLAHTSSIVSNGDWIALGSIGGIIKSMKSANVQRICFAGQVSRPDFSTLKLDLRGVKELPAILHAASKGDDALLRAVIAIFEREGFMVVGADEIATDLLAPIGPLGAVLVDAKHSLDLEKARAIAENIGTLDIGQGAVVCNGLVLAVEAQEGTDAMLRRCLKLPAHLHGTRSKRAGVFAKVPKPTQETRIDLPTLGLQSVQLADELGLAGIGYAAGATFLLEKDAMREAADKAGLFLFGLER